MPGTEDFRINIDHKISEAEARASDSGAIPFGETPEQRRQEFQEALRKILREGQDRDSSNKFRLRLCICSITLASVSQGMSDRETHRSDSADGASSSNVRGRRRSRHDLARLKGRVRTGCARNRGKPLGVFLAASLNI
jgi:hypothetical protein